MPFLIAFFILPVLVFAGAYAAYRYSFYSPRGDQNNDLNYPTEEQYLPYREEGLAMIRHLASAHPWRRTEIRSRDGLRLSARLLEGAEDAPVALCMHGYRGTAFRDFSGGAEMAVSRGFTVLLPDAPTARAGGIPSPSACGSASTASIGRAGLRGVTPAGRSFSTGSRWERRPS